MNHRKRKKRFTRKRLFQATWITLSMIITIIILIIGTKLVQGKSTDYLQKEDNVYAQRIEAESDYKTLTKKNSTYSSSQNGQSTNKEDNNINDNNINDNNTEDSNREDNNSEDNNTEGSTTEATDNLQSSGSLNMSASIGKTNENDTDGIRSNINQSQMDSTSYGDINNTKFNNTTDSNAKDSNSIDGNINDNANNRNESVTKHNKVTNNASSKSNNEKEIIKQDSTKKGNESIIKPSGNTNQDNDKTNDKTVDNINEVNKTNVSKNDTKSSDLKKSGNNEESSKESEKNSSTKAEPVDTAKETKKGEKEENTKNRGMIALTFDDGPHPVITNRILDTLEENQARATFFVLGMRLDKYGDEVKRAYSLDCQIGNHTFNHKDLTKLSVKEIKNEVKQTNDCILKYADVGKALLRPPYGNRNDTVKAVVDVPMICWSVDSEDWKSRDKDTVVKRILDNIQDGDIVLMHDLYESTADAVEEIVPKLIEQGYELVTVDELFEAKGITLEPGVVYHNAR